MEGWRQGGGFQGGLGQLAPGAGIRVRQQSTCVQPGCGVVVCVWVACVECKAKAKDREQARSQGRLLCRMLVMMMTLILWHTLTHRPRLTTQLQPTQVCASLLPLCPACQGPSAFRHSSKTFSSTTTQHSASRSPPPLSHSQCVLSSKSWSVSSPPACW